MPVFIRVKPSEDLTEGLEFLLLHDLLARAGGEDLVGIVVLFRLTFNLSRHLLIGADLPYFVQVIVSTFAWSRSTLLRTSADLRVEKLLSCLRVIQVVSQGVRVGQHHLRSLATRIEAALAQAIKYG